ncbi:MAG: CapA family protein [Acutalibacteraceae bacterium]
MRRTLEPTRTQESIAKQLFERGADAIIGAHSHLVGRMETMDITTRRRKGKRPALWPTASATSFPARAAAMPAAARNRSF